jgi:hypothetical protein
VNGQIQYGSARPLTLPPTVVVRSTPTADPDRFASAATGRPVLLLLGSSLLLGMLLTASPQEVPGMARSIMLGGVWLSLVLVMTLPRQSELAGRELVRRLAQFRHELNAIGDSPSRETLERLVQRVAELGLEEQEVREELQQLHACLDAVDLKARLAKGELPSADAPDPMAPGDTCHFVSPVRFGRRRADQFGHLVLSSGWLKFRGALDMSVAWSEIVQVTRAGREILVRLHDSKRVLRFSCHSYAEAARGGVLAEYFAHAAHVEAAAPGHYEASV